MMNPPHLHEPDGGPIYYESDFDAFIVEPFNMVSAAIFVPIALYWLVRNERRSVPSKFMRFASSLLLVGGIGGTIYHGFRISRLALFMDWMPILILCISAAAYFLHRVYSSTKVVLASSAILLVALFLNAAITPMKYSTNVSYAFMAAYVLGPTLLILYKTGWKNASSILFAFISFGLALFFRIYDRDGILEMGTHFLWHVFGASATFFMFNYVYRLGSRRLQNSHS
jgi:hemolysin III